MSDFKINTAKFDTDGNIVIQDITDSEITIDLGNSEEVMKFLSGLSDKLNELPTLILEAMSNVEIPEKNFKGLNVYLTTLATVMDNGVVTGLSFGVSITNLNKDIRYVNVPYFKVNPKFKLEEGLEHDTFQFVSNSNAQFPIRLEFGQVTQLEYVINGHQEQLFRNNNSEGTTIQAFVSTTVGELYSSDKFSINKLVSTFDSIRQRQ
ncbi:MAG: hypothetical protein ACOWWR_13320 [Eubacteriales bacterium]